MSDAAICLDTGIWIKYLTREEPIELSDAASRLIRRTLLENRLVAPAFAWAEVGSVLRKKVRQRELGRERAGKLWVEFGSFPIEFNDSAEIRRRSWELSERYGLPTLFDAAFLACTELAELAVGAYREFWTTDRELVSGFGANPPPYVRLLTDAVGA